MKDKRRAYTARIVGDKVMMPADLKRLHKYMREVEHIGIVSDDARGGRRVMARVGTQAAAEEVAKLS